MAITLSQAMRQFGLTARALRYYEELGLVVAQRDRMNRRVYEAHAVSRLSVIAEFRRAGLALADIRSILERQEGAAAGDPISFAAARLDQRLQALDRERKAVEAALGALQARRPSTAVAELHA